ncbi:MAG: prepilin-type N-terminal cleavage/methylation domain-containing protein [Candidatus Omnitrophica bacterium]|nr:prepilin-type N-terminal cleavage/methylation domain-containing protein [Candidatus Omnitrophota bacterium]
MTPPRAGRGFTVVEMLVVVSLMALAGGAMVSAFAGGLRVWQRANELSAAGQSGLIAFEFIRRDLRSLRTFSPVPFDGAYDRFSAATVEAERPSAWPSGTLGRIGYFLRERDHVLCRSFVPYAQTRTVSLRDRCEPVLDRVTRLRLRYFGKHPDSGVEAWSSHWSGPSPPLAVTVEVTTQEGRRPPVTQTHTVFLAQGHIDEPTTE